jgi:MPBQ/MSBQ methyltransferase
MLQVVDVGGGTGFCTQGIVKTVSPINVVLMDQSPQQLAKAKKKKDLEGVTIVEARPISTLLPTHAETLDFFQLMVLH